MHQCVWCGSTCTSDAEYVKHMSGHIQDESERTSATEQPPCENTTTQSSSESMDNQGINPAERQVPPHVSTPPLGGASCSVDPNHEHRQILWGGHQPSSPVHSVSSPDGPDGAIETQEDDVKCPLDEEICEPGKKTTAVENEEFAYRCDECNETFPSAVKLRRHQKSHREGAALKTEPSPSKPKHKCDVCEKEYCNLGSLRKHLITHANDRQEQQQKILQALHPCKFCKKVYSGADKLQKHMQTHTGERPFQCEACDKSFWLKQQLQAHIRLKCPNHERRTQGSWKKSNKEEYGDVEEDDEDKGMEEDSDESPEYSPSEESEPEEVVSRQRKKRHPGHQNVSKTNHTNEDRAFMCEVCGKAFRSSTHLKRHVEIHTGKNKYQCHLCLRFLNRKDQLKKHIGGRRCKPMKSSPPPPPEQPVMPVPEIMYRCIVCKNMFTTKVDYINHKASHAQEEFEQATQCPYPRPEENFVGASGDVPVKLTAPEEGRVYPCPNCPLVFEEQTTLNRHFLTHTGQKCFHCRFCHKQFAARRGLVFHMAHSCKQKPAGFRLDDLVKDSQEESEPDAATTPQLAYNAAPMVPLQPGPVLPPNARLPPAKDPINSFPESHHSREPCPDPTLQPQQVSYQAQQFASDDLFPYKSSYNQNMQYNSHIPAKPTATYTTKDNNLRYHDKNIGYGDKSNMLGYADKQSVMEYSSKDTMIMGNTITYGTGDNSVSFVAKDNIVDYETHTSHTVLNYGDTKPTNMDYVNKPGALDFLDKSIDYLRQVTDYTPKVADASYPSWSTNASISVSQEGQNLQQNLGIAVSETGHVLSGDLMMAHSGHTAQSMQAIHSQSIVSVPTATPMGATSGTLTVSEPHVYSAEIPYPVQVLPVTSSCPEQTQLPQQPSVPMQTYTQLTSFIQPPTTTLTNVPSQPPIMQSATLQNTHIQSDPLSTFPAPVVATHNPHDIITAAHQPSSSPQRPSNTITTSMQSVQVDSSTRTTKKESRSKSNDEPRNAMDCPTCGAVFKQVYYFIKHFETSKCAKVGGPVTCKVCGDETVPFEDYVKHVRRHDGLDTYTCSLCFKMYTSSLRYEKHRTQCEAFMKSMGTVKSDSKDDESEISSDKKQVDTDQIGPETVQNYPEVNIAEEDSETLSLQQLEAVGISTLASIESRTLGRNPQILQQGTSSSHPGLEDAENPNESHSERRLLHKAAPVDLGNGTRGFESESSWWELGTGSNFGFQCQVAGCAAILSSKYHLMRHVKSVHSGDEKVVCDICNKTYSSKHSLNTHLLTHSQEKKHKCRYCNTRFRLAATLKRHERRHTGERPHKCPVCTQCFIDISELNRHLAVHNVENPFTCAVCGQAFPRKKMLIYHVKVHRGPRKAKPIHACTACGKRFTSKRSLSFHMRTHTGEQPYECEFCHERFTWLSSYHRHVGQHMGRVHTCHVCHKNFSSLPGLKEHMVGHSDRRDFSCHICGKTFAKRKCWRQHLRVHEGKRHVCTVCGSAFSEVYYLNRHMKIHAPPQHGAM